MKLKGMTDMLIAKNGIEISEEVTKLIWKFFDGCCILEIFFNQEETLSNLDVIINKINIIERVVIK